MFKWLIKLLSIEHKCNPPKGMVEKTIINTTSYICPECGKQWIRFK